MAGAWCVLVTVRSMLGRFGYRRVHGALTRCSPTPGGRIDARRCLANASLVDRVALRWMQPPAKCLHRSLALWWLLRFQGLETQIRTGARRNKDSGAWDLHAWVEHGDIILNDTPDRIATYSLIPEGLAAGIAPGKRPR